MDILETIKWLSDLFESYGLSIVFIFAFAFVIWYLIGGWINLKIARRYAKTIEESMRTRSMPVRYRRISGGRGFRALCLMRNNEIFERVEIAINLADRDNAMHYLLSPITRDEDRFLCWAFMNIKPPSSIEIVPRKRVKAFYKSIRKFPEKYGKFKLYKVDEIFDDEFLIFAEDVGAVSTMFPKRIRDHIMEMRGSIRGISVVSGEDFIRLAGKASEKTIPLLLDLAWEIGKSIAKD
ncbi:MAG: hypothetical protein QXK52_06995 [Candidatus Bathyarchaeia archaeon]